MISFLGRLIGSAQRRVGLIAPKIHPFANCLDLVLDIQGLWLQCEDDSLFFPYVTMAEEGVRQGWSRPLSLGQRLWRKPALIGELRESESHVLSVKLWSNPQMLLEIDLNEPLMVEHWSECYIMIRSAGFDLDRSQDDAFWRQREK
jgi:hypothetical protein